jgi:GNAT superfamily N-acetyltransferase
VVAYDGEQPVGASTCLPLQDATANVQAPFLARGWPVEQYFYLAESVLLPDYRGHGVGSAFFARREAHVRAVSDCAFACFCTVWRPDDHPARPARAISLEPFWRRLGYAPVPDLRCTMAWREIGQDRETDISLRFWMKKLTDAGSHA